MQLYSIRIDSWIIKILLVDTKMIQVTTQQLHILCETKCYFLYKNRIFKLNRCFQKNLINDTKNEHCYNNTLITVNRAMSRPSNYDYFVWNER